MLKKCRIFDIFPYIDNLRFNDVYSYIFIFQVNLCFDQFVYKLSEHVFAYFKAQACR